MNKLLPLLAFSVLLLVPAGAQSAFAQEAPPLGSAVDGDCTSNGTGGGPWSDPNTWDCVDSTGTGSDVPASRKQVTIQSDDTVTVDRGLNRTSGDATTFIGNVLVNGNLVVPSPFTFKADQLRIVSGSVENFGNMIIAEFFNFNIFNNNCGSTLTIQQLITNKGGARGPDGDNTGPLTNFGVFELGILFDINNAFFNFQPFQNGGTLINVIESGPNQNFAAIVPITTIPNTCPLVGGEFLPLDSTALLIAGMSANLSLIVPIAAGIAGVGAYFIKTRMNKE